MKKRGQGLDLKRQNKIASYFCSDRLVKQAIVRWRVHSLATCHGTFVRIRGFALRASRPNQLDTFTYKLILK